MKVRGKRIALATAALLVGLCVLGVLSQLWRYNTWYPAVPWARFTVDGRPTRDLFLFHQIDGEAVIVVSHSKTTEAVYFVVPRHPKQVGGAESYVLPCQKYGISWSALIAVKNDDRSARDLVDE